MILVGIICALIGSVSGILSGLIGISGSLITVPCLVLLFHFLGFAPVYLMQMAIGTSLAAMTFNALAATYSHHQRRSVVWSLVQKMLGGLLIGCIIGAFLAHLLPTALLQVLFGIFACVVGFYFFRQKPFYEQDHPLPNKGTFNAIGFVIASLSNILGIGGGTITMPVFLAFKMPMQKAVATSVATGFIISGTGALSYLFFGLESNFYPQSIGYVYLPAFAILAITSCLTAPLGVRLTSKIPAPCLKKYFAVVLMTAGILMLF